MKSFYLADIKLFEAKITDLDFRVYHYFCSTYNTKKRQPYIRMVDAADKFAIKLDTVKQILNRLSRIIIDGSALISLHDNGKFIEFKMPRYEALLDQIGFVKYKAAKGWKNLAEHLTVSQAVDLSKFLYPKLDQYALHDKLKSLPDDELNKIKTDQLLYPWVLKQIKNERNRLN